MKTSFPRKEDFIDGTRPRNWWVVDAEGQILGRLATRIAHLLRGKHKPCYSGHVDTGDFVIVLNAGKVVVTGEKEHMKMYYRHTGYPGGIKSLRFEEMREKKPEMLVRKAVKGMMAKNALNRHALDRLKIYTTAEHPHQAQQPQILTV